MGRLIHAPRRRAGALPARSSWASAFSVKGRGHSSQASLLGSQVCLFAGNSHDEQMGDTWVLDVAEPVWKRVTVADVPGKAWHSAEYVSSAEVGHQGQDLSASLAFLAAADRGLACAVCRASTCMRSGVSESLRTTTKTRVANACRRFASWTWKLNSGSTSPSQVTCLLVHHGQSFSSGHTMETVDTAFLGVATEVGADLPVTILRQASGRYCRREAREIWA